MVRKILEFIHKEIRGLHEAAYLLAAFALFSQMLGLIRDRLLAHFFGAGTTLDVYYAAFRIPDFIFAGLASMVSLYVLIPFLAERNGTVAGSAARDFIKEMFSAFLLAIALVSLLAFLFTPFLMTRMFPALISSEGDSLILLTRLLLLQPILLGISNIFGSVTQIYGRFALFAVSPLFYNLGIIAGALFLYPLFGIGGLGAGVIAGALMHAGIQLPFIIKNGFAGLKLPALSTLLRVVRLSLPRTLALSATQLALLVLLAFGDTIGEGAIAVFTLASNIQAVPLSIIAVSYSVATFPILSRLFSKGEHEQFLTNVATAARHIIFWSMPALTLFIVLRAQIVRVVLGSGQFNWEDTRLTAAALALFSLSLVAQGLSLLFARGYYAAGNTRKPLFINLGTAALTVLFALLFLHLFQTNVVWKYFFESLLRVEGISGTEVLALPLGYSLAALLNVTSFWIFFERDFSRLGRALRRSFLQIFAASIVAGFAAYRILQVFGEIFDLDTFLGIFTQGFLGGVGGVAVWVIVLVVLKNDELHEVLMTLRGKIFKAKTVAAEENPTQI